MIVNYDYDVIVVGGGHAGVEACLASAKLNKKTLLITLNFNMVANMPCNPSIGGSAKGIVVREIDALGGFMGKAADYDYLQMKMLNTAKGVGVRCLRAQEDKLRYPKYVQNHIKNSKNLDVLEDEVKGIIFENDTIYGVILSENRKIYARAVVLSTGTYMNSEIMVGHSKVSGGPDGEKPSVGLSDYLRNEMGLDLIRLKTGTPQRLAKESIDFSKAEIQLGNVEDEGFSYESTCFKAIKDQEPCYLIYTNEKTHKIIRDNLLESSMYGGIVKGVGPRYCPSIEDKLVRFADKPRHQLFLEPESYDTNSIYLQGFSTSMPKDIQEKMVHSLSGLENAKILKYAYAIEYDAFETYEYTFSLMTKKYKGLFIAGQICGTSGYEEAAGLGLIAGINASRYIDNLEPLILGRDEAYIGVMIDDLVTKGTKEPYRLLSSRAEYRLLLRSDNADYRLTEIGKNIGLIDDERYLKFKDKYNKINQILYILKTTYLGETSSINEGLLQKGYERLNSGVKAIDILKRNGISYSFLKNYISIPSYLSLDKSGEEEIEIIAKYEGYIEGERKEVAKFKKLENLKLKESIDYSLIDGLALEARQKLNKIKPLNIGQASRISGVNPSDIAILIMNLKNKKI